MVSIPYMLFMFYFYYFTIRTFLLILIRCCEQFGCWGIFLLQHCANSTNMWKRFTKSFTYRGPNSPCLPAANIWLTDVQRHNHKRINTFLVFVVWFTFRMFICFLKRSENSFFLFEESSSLLPPSNSSYLQGVVTGLAYRFTWSAQYWIHLSKWDKLNQHFKQHHKSYPASRNRSPSFLLHKALAGNQTAPWALCSELQSWCWGQPPAPTALVQL